MVLGIIFGASSLYLVLKVGMTVSASIPVAVLSITLFRGMAIVFRVRPATILENNIVQTTGSAGESIAFGVGVTIPALLLLGHDMSIVRVITVGSLGGLLGILMMIPLRRAFIVQQHGKLRYPEGTACADVLIVGEEGGSTARTVFAGFGLAFRPQVLRCSPWASGPRSSTCRCSPPAAVCGQPLIAAVCAAACCPANWLPSCWASATSSGRGSPSIMMAGGVLAYLVLVPLVMLFGSASDAAPGAGHGQC